MQQAHGKWKPFWNFPTSGAESFTFDCPELKMTYFSAKHHDLSLLYWCLAVITKYQTG
jgi:hypothetical protein